MITRRLHFLFFLFLIYSCSTKHQPTETITPVAEEPKVKQELKAGEITATVICENNSSLSYALYLPKNYSVAEKFPVIIFFDPHGSGSYPVGLYQSLAEKFGYILVGSHNAKNGLQYEQTNEIVSGLIAECGSRFSTDKKRISLAGFSGGSKVALEGASYHPELLSVIYCGAAIPFDNINSLPPALGFAGVKDMNYTEVMSSGTALDEKKIVHAVIEWKGKHEWPDTVSFEDAFYWCNFNAIRNKLIATDQNLIKVFLQKKNKLIASSANMLSLQNNYNQLIVFLQGVTDVSAYSKKMNSLIRSEKYNADLRKQQAVLQMESSLKQNYLDCFQTKDLNWWQEEISRMRSLKTGEHEMMYQRLLGYISLASNSYSNNAIKQNNYPAARQFLAIYKLADPENPDQPYLTACMYARQGDQGKAISALQESIQLGFKDKGKIQNEESFSILRGNPEYNKLLAGL